MSKKQAPPPVPPPPEGKPFLYVSNWASWRHLHGPGKKWSIMLHGRHWEHGDGRIAALTPLDSELQRYWSNGDLDGYRKAYWTRLAPRLAAGDLAQHSLIAEVPPGLPRWVESGDTICCGCSRDDAAVGKCHRAWTAQALQAAGWSICLDGVWLP